LDGIVAGAFLLIVGILAGSDLKTQIPVGSAILILLAGAINYLYRE